MAFSLGHHHKGGASAIALCAYNNFYINCIHKVVCTAVPKPDSFSVASATIVFSNKPLTILIILCFRNTGMLLVVFKIVGGKSQLRPSRSSSPYCIVMITSLASMELAICVHLVFERAHHLRPRGKTWAATEAGCPRPTIRA